MSYVIHILRPPLPDDDEQAWTWLSHRPESPKEAETPSVFHELIGRLSQRYPCPSILPAETRDDSPWPEDLPSGGIAEPLALGIVPNRVDEVQPFVVETANQLGLIVMDMQAGHIYRPGEPADSVSKPASEVYEPEERMAASLASAAPSRAEGWIFALAGVALFVAGIASLADPASGPIRIGAIIVSPFLVYRGVRILRRVWEEDRLSDYERGVLDAPHPAGLTAVAIRHTSVRGEATCESCGKDYVYFPQMTPQSQIDVLEGHGCVAPCPRCGWIQKSMQALAQRDAPGISLLLSAGAIVLFSAVMYTIFLFSSDLGANRWKYWLVLPGVVLVGVAFFVAAWLWTKKWDPNRQAKTKRLELARKLCLPREAFETMVDAGEAPREPPPTHVRAENAGISIGKRPV